MTVYVIGCERSRLVKIGHTGNPTKRLGEIWAMSPYPLRLLWQSSPEHGESSERKLHQILKSYRVHGEWFDFGDADPIGLVAAAINLPAPPPPKPKLKQSPKPPKEPKPKKAHKTAEIKAPPPTVFTPRTYEVDEDGHQFYIEDGHRYVLLPEEEFLKAWDEGCAEYYAAQAEALAGEDVA